MALTFREFLETPLPGSFGFTNAPPLTSAKMLRDMIAGVHEQLSEPRPQVPFSESYSKYTGDYKKFEVRK